LPAKPFCRSFVIWASRACWACRHTCACVFMLLCWACPGGPVLQGMRRNRLWCAGILVNALMAMSCAWGMPAHICACIPCCAGACPAGAAPASCAARAGSCWFSLDADVLLCCSASATYCWACLAHQRCAYLSLMAAPTSLSRRCCAGPNSGASRRICDVC
jgi:hypothetical protein